MKQTIEVEGLPEGWKAVAYRLGKEGEMAFITKVWELEEDSLCPVIIVEKIQPRRKVLEETEEDNEEYHNLDGSSYYADQHFGDICLSNQPKIWRKVKE